MRSFARELRRILSLSFATRPASDPASLRLRARSLLRVAGLLSALLALPGFGAEGRVGVAVFGSYVDAELAERERFRLGAVLSLELRVVEAFRDGMRRHRIVTERLPEAQARQRIERAWRGNGQDGWFLADSMAAATRQASAAYEDRAASSRRRTQVARPRPVDDAPTLADAAVSVDERALEEDLAPLGDAVAASVEAAVDAPRTVAAAPMVERRLRSADSPPANDDAVSVVVATRIENPNIVVDGRVDEPAWREAPAYDNMRVMEPETLDEPTYGTASRFIYTNDGLYVSAVMEQPADTLVARLSSRDQYINRDGYGITLDTSGAGLYGYWFTVNLGGSLADGKVAAERSITHLWDGPWTGASAVTDTGWSVEMFLPWSMMSMPQSGPDRTLGFWIDRKVAHMDERYSWPVLPFTSPRFMSALKPMALEQVRPARQWAVFPYAVALTDGIQDEQTANAGLDVVWRPSTNVQLTAAVNPDFGAVESDDVVVNLTAFETFFPEKRLFFLEGNEVFETSPRANPQSSSSGPQGQGARRSPQTFFREPTTLLNTRRIGGAPRHVDVPDEWDIPGVELSTPTDLLGAAKLVGQSGGVRYGLLSAFEDDVQLRGTRNGVDGVFTAEGRNFSAARLLYEHSTSGGRRGIGYMGTMVDKSFDTARVHGVDTHWLGGGGKVEWDTQFIASEVDEEWGYGVYTDIAVTPRIGTFMRCSLDYLEADLNVGDLGFVRRTDLAGAVCGVFQYFARGLPDSLRNIRTSIFASYEENTDGLPTRAGLFVGTGFTFRNNSQLRLMANYFPKRWDDLNSRGMGAFRVTDRVFAQAQFGTDSSKPFAFSVALGVDGEEQGGSALLFDTGFTFTPFHRFSVDFDVRYKDRDGWLVYRGDGRFTTYRAYDIQPRIAIDLFLSARQQLRLTTQWAGIRADEQQFLEIPDGGGELRLRDAPKESDDFAISRLVAQLRYRWEIGPLSDLFVVYTRGANLPDRVDDGFNDLFLDALEEPIVDVFIIKLRYRFGS